MHLEYQKYIQRKREKEKSSFQWFTAASTVRTGQVKAGNQELILGSPSVQGPRILVHPLLRA